MVTSRHNWKIAAGEDDDSKTRLVEIDFFSDRFAAHMTNLERFGALGTGSVTAQEGYIATSFHADAAAVRLFDFHDFTLQVAQSVGGWLAIVLGVEQLLSVDGNTPLYVHPAGQAFLHADSTFFAGDLMLTRIEDDKKHLFVADDTFLRDIGNDWQTG